MHAIVVFMGSKIVDAMPRQCMGGKNFKYIMHHFGNTSTKATMLAHDLRFSRISFSPSMLSAFQGMVGLKYEVPLTSSLH